MERLESSLRNSGRVRNFNGSRIVYDDRIPRFFKHCLGSAVMPATGVALPFVSYGGNATWVYCAAVGILLNIARHSKKPIAKRQYIGDDS